MPVPMPVPLRANANMRLEAKYNVITEFPSFDLHSAAATGNMGLVEYALSRGQPINSVLDGVLPLHAACAGGNEQVVRLLLEHGADVNAPRLPRRYSNDKNRDTSAPIVGTSGSTPLHFAAANGNTGIVSALLLKGAHADRADKHGITAEQLARQNGWLECADVLRKWLDNKDRDLRERAPLLRAESPLPRQGSVGVDGKRLKVKRSVDTALNMLKASSSALTDAYNNKSHTCNNNLSTPPASPIHSGDNLLENGRVSPGLSPGARRPSLPYLPSSSGSPRAQRARTPATQRRPRSAGTGAEQDPDTNSPKGSTRKLGTKYSLMNIFKKNDGIPLERVPSHSPSVSSISSLQPAPTAKPIPIASSPPASDTLGPPISGSSLSTNGFRRRLGSDAPQSSPPSAVDIHNAMAQQQQNRRDRSGSSSSRFESSGLGLSFDGNTSTDLSSSSASRNPLRTRQLGHTRHRSGSAHRNAAVFDDDVLVVPDNSSQGTPPMRPSILRTHNRSSSSQGGGLPSSLRALRFDSTSSTGAGIRLGEAPPLRGSNSANSLVRFAANREGNKSESPAAMSPKNGSGTLPESAPPTVSDFRSKPMEEYGDDENEDEEEYYGRAYEHNNNGLSNNPRRRGPSVSSLASDSSLLPSNFPFSIHSPPPIPNEEGASLDGRDRGNSVSSTSTDPNLSTGDSTSTSAGSVTATPPQLSPRSSMHGSTENGPRVYVDGPNDRLSSIDLSASAEVLNVKTRKTRSPLDIDINSISSHAQAEALVHRAAQDILEMAHDDSDDAETPSSRTPLSARLAAYGESLAKLRELRQQAEKIASAEGTNADQCLQPSRSCNRQRSMEERLVSGSSRTKQPRRPHTSSGTSSCESITAPYNHSVDTSRLSRHQPSQSTSAMDGFQRPPIRLPAGSLYMRAPQQKQPSVDQLSRVSSLDGHDTDTELGPALFRVSTAPHTSMNAKGKQARHMASSNKLTRMGFRNDTVARSSPSSKRFGGLKSLMQTFKGKPTYD